MRSWLFLLGSSTLLHSLNAQGQSADRSSNCAATVPYSPEDRLKLRGGSYGTKSLSVGLSSDVKTIFKPGGPGFVLEDVALAMKFPWFWDGGKAQLTIEGRRLDAPAAPLRSVIPVNRMYGNGFQPSSVIFPTPGCW